MNVLKAFGHIGPFVNNANKVVAPIGELSGRSATFKRDIALYSDEIAPNVTLAAFSYTVEGVVAPLPQASATACLRVIKWVYDQARLLVFTEQKTKFQQEFIAAFGAEYELIDSGIMVSSGSMFAPEYVTFAPYDQAAGTHWKIWLSDQAFFNQFDEFEAVIVPPLVNLDAFFGSYSVVKDLIAAVKMQDVLTRIADAADGDPYTVLRPDVYRWQDPTNPDLRIDTDWSTILYGIAGDNPDAVREATRVWILENSTRTHEEWAAIFPEIFMSTEFIITPQWHRYAIPNKTRDAGVFSSIINAREATELCYLTCMGVGYTPEHISGVMEVVPALHRSVMLSVVGGPENRDGINRLSLRFPDLINVPTTHIDFMRMSQETRDFVLLLAEMLDYAETLTESSAVPKGFNRLVRDGVVYLAVTRDRFLYLVVSKGSVDNAVGG